MKNINLRSKKLETSVAGQAWVNPFDAVLTTALAKLEPADQEALERHAYHEIPSKDPELWERLDQAMAIASKDCGAAFTWTADCLLLL